MVIGAVLVAAIGLVALAAGFDEGIRQADKPVYFMDWVWACVDMAVPAFLLYALGAISVRDDLERQLAASAERDPLTGLPNRAGFASQGLVLLEACWKAQRPVALAMLDIDHFKQINDGWGHAAGDAALRGLAQVVRDDMRTADICARYGGEEFILMMFNVDLDEALVLVERLRQAITEGVPHPGAPERRVTISAGIAPVEGQDIAAIEAAAKAADSALYLAKEGGRDRAVIASRGTLRAKN
jgi:diguanylate cyclase (GGDEF)-like protein